MKTLSFSILLLLCSLLSLSLFSDEAQPIVDDEVRFVVVDVWMDSGKKDCAAWQCEVLYDKARISILSLEGGKDFFKEPPFYDKRGLKAGHIYLAAFTTEKKEVPEGKVLIGRLHLQVLGDAAPTLDIKLIDASSFAGEEIKPSFEIRSRP